MPPQHNKLRIASARVMNFGCFRDSGEVPLDDVTALIAENENGKTTFLRALSWWSDQSEKFDSEDRWDEAGAQATLDLVAVTFDLNAPAATALREAGIAKVPKQVRVLCDSTNHYRIEDPLTGTELETTRGRGRYEVARDALIESLNLYESDALMAGTLAKGIRTAQPGSGVAEDAIPKIRADVLPHLTAVDQAVVEELVAELEGAMASPTDEMAPTPAIDVVTPYLPDLIYFDERVDFVQDAITYAEVTANPKANRTMINLANIAGVPLEDIATAGPHKRQQYSRESQQTLSAEFSKYWQGDPVTIYVQVDESQITLNIEHKGRTQRPSRRSSGLKWQLGFFVNFTAEIKGDLSGAVLLLDEPGLHLHIRQQPRLLKLFDDLAKDGCRIIYATHLSHMLSPEKPHTFRPLIQDPDNEKATKVVASIMAVPSKSDVMQPVRQALGMGIADAIGLGGMNVVAEGWAERYALIAMSDFCRDAGSAALSERTTILPAGGSGKKMLPLAAMAVAEKTKAVVLVDDDHAGRATITLIEKTLPGAVPCVKTHDEAESTERELEDVFDPTFYLDLVNSSHADVEGYKAIALKDVALDKPICDAIEARFKANGLGKFQKLRAAMELQKRHEAGIPPSSESIARFAGLFERLNAALDVE